MTFHDVPGLEIEIINSMTFQVFHDLCEPCINGNFAKICGSSRIKYLLMEN